jgi:hypothetical protein
MKLFLGIVSHILKVTIEIFSDHLNDVDWDNLFDEKSVDEMWTIFSKIMSDGMDKFIPKRKSDDRFFNPPLWMDRNTKSAIIKKRIMEIL